MDIIKLNVGGIHFETTKDTLTKSPYFNAMFNGKWSVSEDEIFIDKSGKIFEHVLNLLRDPNYYYPEKYLSELDFYLINKPKNIISIFKKEYIDDIKNLIIGATTLNATVSLAGSIMNGTAISLNNNNNIIRRNNNY